MSCRSLHCRHYPNRPAMRVAYAWRRTGQPSQDATSLDDRREDPPGRADLQARHKPQSCRAPLWRVVSPAPALAAARRRRSARGEQRLPLRSLRRTLRGGPYGSAILLLQVPAASTSAAQGRTLGARRGDIRMLGREQSAITLLKRKQLVQPVGFLPAFCRTVFRVRARCLENHTARRATMLDE